MTATLILNAGKSGSVRRRHPWIFAGSVATLKGRARSGDTVIVEDEHGTAMGRAAWSPESKIRARMWTFDPDETIDHAFFKRRVAQAVARRLGWSVLRGNQIEPAGERLIHGEADGLPGVIADRYGDTVVLQLTSAGADAWRDAIVAGIVQATHCKQIYERSDSDVRKLEGLMPVTGWLEAMGLHETPHQTYPQIDEHGVNFGVDVVGGHKTGFYLDQRDNRLLLRSLAKGRRILNCFCYTGGFSLQALAGGAESVISIDSSGPALEQARANLAMNPQLDGSRAEWRDADVFQALRDYHKAGERFDLIVLDPPKFAPSAAHADQAARAYKDVNLFGFKLLAPGGLLMTYSCSGGIGVELFQKIVASAAADAGRDARILRRLMASSDHPVGLAAPEGEYLKGLLVEAA
ncbi:MAG: 23S rRNA (cytosine(1962)-C(5))-methyltransferase RlmI [Rhodocyclaceae bacterium]|nr:23S rRNA (cytosine(1962)-C(5))-methyltransferase RlmI [Rhodocyclaceae bacterium]